MKASCKKVVKHVIWRSSLLSRCLIAELFDACMTLYNFEARMMSHTTDHLQCPCVEWWVLFQCIIYSIIFSYNRFLEYILKELQYWRSIVRWHWNKRADVLLKNGSHLGIWWRRSWNSFKWKPLVKKLYAR